MNQWTLAQVADWISKLIVKNHANALVSGASVDSRLLKKNDIFFALPGERVDGHTFLSEAAAKGAVAAIVNKTYSGPNFGLQLIPVESPLTALQQFAAAVHRSRKSKVVALTGSLGKTSTKEFLKTILSTTYRVSSTPGNSNSQIGLPLAILNNMSGDEEIIVLEMGMTQAGNILNLVKIAPPDIAVLTSIDLVHACNFSSLEEIAHAKAEIFLDPNTSLGIISRDVSYFEQINRTGRCRKISYSINTKDADFFLEAGNDCLRIHIKGNSVSVPVLELPGRHNQANLLAAIAVARELEVSWSAIQQAIPKLTLPDNRLQHVVREGILFVNDSYNASEESTKAALASLPFPPSGRKTIAVIGEMMELGEFSEACHRSVGEFALLHADSMICLGKGCKPIVERWNEAGHPVEWYFTLEEVVKALRCQVKPNDVVLLKGSRKNDLGRVLNFFEKCEKK